MGRPRHRLLAAAATLALAACGDAPDTARGVDRGETLLSVSASGHAESRPDKAQFQAGIETWAASATAASAANAKKIAEIVSALKASGVEDKDVQTRTVSVQRIDWGPRKGQFQASNVVNVTLRQADKVSEAVAAVTQAGANIVSGPDLSMTDPEKVANLAYADAYKAARRRAEAYAGAADMEIARVLYIRDAGGQQGDTYFRAADTTAAEAAAAADMAPSPPPVAPPPVMQSAAPPEQGPPRVMLGTTSSDVFIQVDFALRPK